MAEFGPAPGAGGAEPSPSALVWWDVEDELNKRKSTLSLWHQYRN